MSLRLYVGTTTMTDIRTWATPDSLQNAVTAYATSDTFTVKLANNLVRGAGVLPIVPTGGQNILYIDYTNSTTYEILFAGVIMSMAGDDPRENVTGTQTLTCATPVKNLKRIMEYVAFSPVTYPNDRARVLRLGVIAALPGWDWTSGISATPSITYSVPPLGEPLTEYEFQSIESIMNELATDPGRFGDTGYPVPTRRWWVSARLATPATPSAGVTWVMNYQGAFDVPAAAYELKDRKASPSDTAKIYEAGATWNVDWRNVIRSINIAGPRTEPVLCTWQHMTNVTAGHGHISKIGGTNGTWDAGAVSRQRIKGGDWEALATVQEFYLAHDTFQVDDGPRLIRANTGQYWQHLFGDYNEKATLGTRGFLAVSSIDNDFPHAVLECHAANCILRSHFTRNRRGQRIIFRVTDIDNLFMVTNVGTQYKVVRRQAGVGTDLGTFGPTPADGHEIKVFLLGSQFQFYVDDVFKLQINSQTFNQNATKHGLAVDCNADATSIEAAFYDFQCTTFFSDDAFGIGSEIDVTSWVDISYGFVKNNNGTLTATEGGVTYETDDYSYNDKLRIATMQYFVPSSASLERMVVWEKLPLGMSEWERIRTRTTGVVALDETHPWYVGFAGSDLGATLNNISLRKQYANQFQASTTLYGTVPGDWPANGLLQSDELDAYVKRQTRADAIFRQSALPRISQNCVLPPTAGAPPFHRGELVQVTNHQAGWRDAGGGDDTRQVLVLTEMQRLETRAHLLRPGYRLQLESQNYDTDLSGQRHLLKGSVRTRKPDNRGAVTQSLTDPTVFEWPDPTGDENFGQALDVQLARTDSAAYANAQQPIDVLNPDASAIQLDRASLVPGAKYVLRHRTRTTSGLTSDWSQSSPFVAPPQPTYERPYYVEAHIGDGVNAINTAAYVEVQLPESGTITGWSISDISVTFAPHAKVDVLYASEQDHKTIGASAYASLSPGGTDLPTFNTFNPVTHGDNTRLDGWSTSVNAGDWLQFKVLASPVPTARQITVVLYMRRGQPTP